MERNNDPANELTRPPWYWKWTGSAGCWSLLGQNDITYSGPDTADGRLMAAAPELLQVCKELAAWLIIAPEFQDWPAAKSYLKQLNQVIAQIEGEAVNG